MHCKDWSPTEGYAVVFGEGAAPWQKIFEAAGRPADRHYLIEQEAGPADQQLQRAEIRKLEETAELKRQRLP
jgi:hypothetical protein